MQKKSAKEFIIHEASLFTINLRMNKIIKNSDLCHFLSIEEQGTPKTNKMKITKGNSKSQRFENSFRSTSCSNFASISSINSNFTKCAPQSQKA
jgi:hypothetical protein